MTKLNKDDADKLLSYLKDKWKGKTCPMCEKGNWIVQDNFFQITQYDATSFVIGGSVIPVIPVICDNCSNMLLLNAIIAGVIKPNKTTALEQTNDKFNETDKD